MFKPSKGETLKKLMVILALSIFALQSFAAASSDSSYNRYDNQITGAFGYAKGGIGFGFEYERPISKGLGWGGAFRMNPLKQDGNTVTANGLNYFGGFIRPHFHSREWSLNFTMGAGMAQVKSVEDKTIFATNFGTGIFYQMTKEFAMGVEQTSLFGWLQEDYPGLIAHDMLVKARMGF